MDAKLYGFRLDAEWDCTIGQLGGYVASLNRQEFEFMREDRMLFAGRKDGYCVGMLLTKKDRRTFPELDEREITIHFRRTTDGFRAFDFNFFAFSEELGSGVYQHYWGSCPVSTFAEFLKQRYDDLARNECRADVETFRNRGAIRRHRSRQLSFRYVLKRQNFEEMVRNLPRATAFEFDVVAPADMSVGDTPLPSLTRLERRTFKLVGDVTGGTLLEAIRNLLPGTPDADRRFRVIGKDEDGRETPVDLVSRLGAIDSDDFDQIADDVTLTIDDITRSPQIDRLIGLIQANAGLFGAEERE